MPTNIEDHKGRMFRIGQFMDLPGMTKEDLKKASFAQVTAHMTQEERVDFLAATANVIARSGNQESNPSRK
jgi:hypothetical protein